MKLFENLRLPVLKLLAERWFYLRRFALSLCGFLRVFKYHAIFRRQILKRNGRVVDGTVSVLVGLLEP